MTSMFTFFSFLGWGVFNISSSILSNAFGLTDETDFGNAFCLNHEASRVDMTTELHQRKKQPRKLQPAKKKNREDYNPCGRFSQKMLEDYRLQEKFNL